MGSVRSKKTFRELPSTPLPIPYAMRSWNVSNATNSHRAMDDTPLRPSQLPPISKITLSEYPRKSPEKQKKLSMLPGFQNAFETSTPMRSPSKRLNKGKGKMEYDQLVADAPLYNTSRGLSQQHLDTLQFPPQEGFIGSQESPANQLSPIPLMLEKGQTKDKDMDAASTINDESEEVLLPLDPIEDVNWKLEVCSLLRLLFNVLNLLVIPHHLDSFTPYVWLDHLSTFIRVGWICRFQYQIYSVLWKNSGSRRK